MRVLPCLWAWLAVCPALPAEAAETAKPSVAPGVPGVETLGSTLLGLALILLLIFAMAWLFKRFGNLPLGGKGLVRVLGGTSLGARERVVVIEVEETRLVLGVSPGRVQTLHVLPPGRDFEQSLRDAQEPGR